MFAPKIEVYADIERFAFRREGSILELEPFLYVSNDGEQRILHIGEHPQQTHGSHYVHLFRRPPERIEYTALLSAFLRHAFASLLTGRVSLRPHVVVVVSADLAEFLGGYHVSVFSAAVRDAGAPGGRIEVREDV